MILKFFADHCVPNSIITFLREQGNNYCGREHWRNNMTHIDLPKESITPFCIQHQIKRLALFGSVLRDDFRSDSDIDVIVEFVPGKRVGMLTMSKIERELSQILGGRKVDLRTPAELSRYFRDDVMQKAEVCYDA
jgi:predicted nucleotidyltransferase